MESLEIGRQSLVIDGQQITVTIYLSEDRSFSHFCTVNGFTDYKWKYRFHKQVQEVVFEVIHEFYGCLPARALEYSILCEQKPVSPYIGK